MTAMVTQRHQRPMTVIVMTLIMGLSMIERYVTAAEELMKWVYLMGQLGCECFCEILMTEI